jgi:hypothetical protein
MLTLHRSTRAALCCTVAVLAACAKKDTAASDTSSTMVSTSASTTAAGPAPISLADVAGKWDMRSVPTTGDTTPTTFVLNATGTTSGWTITFPGRAPIEERVAVSGDSIIVQAGPYPSVRRKGVQVSTNGALRLQGGNLVGTNTAHYKQKGADSVLTLNTTGTRSK